MRLPGNTRPGPCAMPIEPGVLCERELPCVARFEQKWWRLITPAKPLPFVVPVTSTIWPTLDVSTPIFVAGLELGGLVRRDPELLQHDVPPSTPALARWPACGLLTREARRLP